MTTTLILTRITALALGAAAAGVGCYASYESAARADGGYLMVAAPVLALIAAAIPICFDRAFHDRQRLRGIVLFIAWLPCAATVFYTAAERVHMAKAGGEAQRAAQRLIVDRAKADLAEAKAAAIAATLAANKLRAGDGPKARSAKATETAAISRAADAEAALAAAEAKAITEAAIKQPDWLQPLALDLAGMILIGAGFGLGRAPAPSVAAPVEAPEPAPPVLTPRQIAARKGWEKRRQKKQAQDRLIRKRVRELQAVK